MSTQQPVLIRFIPTPIALYPIALWEPSLILKEVQGELGDRD